MTKTTGTELEAEQEAVHGRSWIRSWISAAVLLIALVALLSGTSLTFFKPKKNGDTFMTLAGGRDVVDGKLAQPDDWSFVTEGQVWVNQSWGTGWLFYELWKQFGTDGLLAYKGVVLGLIALFVVLSARQARVNWGIGILTATYVIAGAQDSVGLRANLLGLAMLSMMCWLLFRSFDRPRRVWWAVGLLALWAQMHGSFVFGIAVMGLWVVINEFLSRRSADRGVKIKPRWTLWAAVAAAPVLAAVTSPYGLTNLTQPFTLMGFFLPEKWPLFNFEMTPILLDHPNLPPYPALAWFLFLLGMLAAPLVLRVTRPSEEITRIKDLDSRRRTIWVFSLALAIVTVFMTLSARRFLPVCMIACAPLLAFEAQWVLSNRRYAWPAVFVLGFALVTGLVLTPILAWMNYPETANAIARQHVLRWSWGAAAVIMATAPMWGALIGDWNVLRRKFARFWEGRYRSGAPAVIGVMLLAVLLYSMPTLRAYYSLGHPLLPDDGVFGRVVTMHEFPEDGAAFLKQNAITGNALNEWSWEGYLHWIHPEMKVMVGGRSRQIYSPTAAANWDAALKSKERSIASKLGIQLMVLPITHELATTTFTDPQSPWRIIYFDGRTVIAALQSDPQSRQLEADAEAGKLKFPTDRGERYTTAARHLAMVSERRGAEIINAVGAATRLHPSPQLYQLLLAHQNTQRVPLVEIVKFYETELTRLDAIDYHRAEGFAYLQSRQLMAASVANFYTKLAEHTGTKPDRERIQFWRQYARDCGAAGIAFLAGSREPNIRPIPEPFARP